MKFILILIVLGFDNSGKTMVEFRTPFKSEYDCNNAGLKFKQNNNIGRGNWKEFDCISVEIEEN